MIHLALLMAFHWIGDFLLQSDWMAVNKSRDNGALFSHVAVYTETMTVGAMLVLGTHHPAGLLAFGGITFITHAMTDYVTSRITAWLYTRSRHYFFVMIGLDQWIHVITLAVTAHFTLARGALT